MRLQQTNVYWHLIESVIDANKTILLKFKLLSNSALNMYFLFLLFRAHRIEAIHHVYIFASQKRFFIEAGQGSIYVNVEEIRF